jgi:hypothetical protein
MLSLKVFFIGLALVLGTVSAVVSVPKVDLWKLAWVSLGLGFLLA